MCTQHKHTAIRDFYKFNLYKNQKGRQESNGGTGPVAAPTGAASIMQCLVFTATSSTELKRPERPPTHRFVVLVWNKDGLTLQKEDVQVHEKIIVKRTIAISHGNVIFAWPNTILTRLVGCTSF